MRNSVACVLVACALMACGGSSKKNKPHKRQAAVRMKPVSLERWNQVRLVRVDSPPDPYYWLRIPGEWYRAGGLGAAGYYRYQGERELKIVTRPGLLQVNGKSVGVDLSGRSGDQVRVLIDPVEAKAISVSLDDKQTEPALWKAVAGLKATELLIHVKHEPYSDKPQVVGPILSRIRKLGKRVVGLALGGKGFDDDAISGLRGLDSLRFLSLQDSRLTAAGLARLVDATPGLETLLISWHSARKDGITDAGLEHLSRLSRLQRLEVNGKRIRKKGLRALRRLKYLRVLSLVVGIITDRDLMPVGDLSGLTWLNIWFPHFGPAVMGRICRLKSLIVLHISPDVTPTSMRCLAGLTELRSLALRDPSVTDATLAHVRSLVKLEDLQLSGCAITGSGLRHLRTHTRLRRLNLSRVAAPFDSAALQHLGALPNLEVLDLGWLPILPSHLTKLHGVKSLRVFNVYGANTLGPQDMVEIKKALPRCDVRGPK